MDAPGAIVPPLLMTSVPLMVPLPVSEALAARLKPSAKEWRFVVLPLLHRVNRRAKRRNRFRPRCGGWERLAERHQQCPEQRPGSPANFHDKRHSGRLQRRWQRFGRQLVDVGQHGLRAALHVQAMVAVPNRLVERGQLVRMRDDGAGNRFKNHALARLLDRHRISTVPGCS